MANGIYGREDFTVPFVIDDPVGGRQSNIVPAIGAGMRSAFGMSAPASSERAKLTPGEAPRLLPSHAPSLGTSRQTPNALGLSQVTPVPQPAGIRNRVTTIPAGSRFAAGPNGGFVAASGVEGNFATPEQQAELAGLRRQVNDIEAGQALGGLMRGDVTSATANREAWNRAVEGMNAGQEEELPTAASVLGDVSLSGIGGLAAINLASRLAGQERGIRYKQQAIAQEMERDREAQLQSDIQNAQRDEQLGINRRNADIAAENAQLSGIKTQFDIARGLREMNKVEAPPLRTVEMGDIDGTKRTYVETPQGFVPFEEYQLRQQAGEMTPDAVLSEARAALAAGKDRASVISRLQALGIDPNLL